MVPALAEDHRVAEQTVVILMSLQVSDPALPFRRGKGVQVAEKAAGKGRIARRVDGRRRAGGGVPVAADLVGLVVDDKGENRVGECFGIHGFQW
ncbi:hypothetical protein HQ520_04370 [bacterium]|nr:hypothetical protein [bacterium]